MEPLNVLVMNAGSSSQKSCLFRIEGTALPDNPPEPIWSGKIEWNAPSGASLTTTVSNETTHETLAENTSRQDGVSQLLTTLWNGDGAVLGGPQEIAVVGHRVVHGGPDIWQPTRVTTAVKQAIQLAPLAPEHNPAAREGMETIDRLLGPEAVQVAVFDTGFHRTIPKSATTYPGPYSWVKDGIRRYGFHGINHAWCAERASRLLTDHGAATRRLICCHLGNGCSLAAIHGGTCIDTTMGFTPMDGLMMGSRSGSVDPGILLYLLEQPGGPSPADLGRILNEQSGLKGLSGVSGDLRAVVSAINTSNERARLAWDVYIHRLRWYSPPVWARTAPRFGPMPAHRLVFWVFRWMKRRTKEHRKPFPTPSGTFPTRIRASAFSLSPPTKIGRLHETATTSSVRFERTDPAERKETKHR